MIYNQIPQSKKNEALHPFVSDKNFKVLVISCLAYIIFSPTVRLGAFAAISDEAKPTEKVAHFSVVETEDSKEMPLNVKSVSMKTSEKQKVVIPKQKFGNLTFVLNADFAKRNQISKKIVQEKLENCKQYIQKNAILAQAEMKASGVPASITLAQALLESDAGESGLARATNNQFGIKCFSHKCKKGHCQNFTDDSHKDFFLKHKTVGDSYKMHSQFLKQPRYSHLFKLANTDCTAWANGLVKLGYATDKQYSQKLLKIIDAFGLCRFDNANVHSPK